VSVTKLENFIEVLWAATLTHRVESRFQSRGGILLVAPPAHFKTTMLRAVEDMPGVQSYSDITTTGLVEARDMIASKKIHTLMFYDLQKIYERKAETASNIIGSLRALMDEGFTTAAFENAGTNMIQMRARALVLAATTPAMYRRVMGDWDESGFSRRLIFSVYSLQNPEVLVKAIMQDEPLQLAGLSSVNVPFNLSIKLEEKPGDENALRKLLRRGQRGEEIPLILLRKILAVLRWKAKAQHSKDYSLDILREFGKSMGDEGVEVQL